MRSLPRTAIPGIASLAVGAAFHVRDIRCRTAALARDGRTARIIRRGGSEPLHSPATIPPSLMLHELTSPTAGAVWVIHPTHPDAGGAVAAMGCDKLRPATIIRN